MLAKKILIVFSILAASGCDASFDFGGSLSPPFKKLVSSSHIKIFKYFIDLDVFFGGSEDPMYYTGDVEILFAFKSKINTIDIHGTAFATLNVKLFGPVNKEEYTLNYTTSPVDDKIILQLPQELDIKYNVQYYLKFNYKHRIGKNFIGVFYTTYSDNNGLPVGYVATRTQPAFARHVFPCFDEPALKATFAITLTHDSKYTALSNEQEFSRVPVNLGSTNNRTKTTFHITQKMSTYNVAFVISDFQNLNATDINDVMHRVFYNTESKFDAAEQLKNSIRTVEYLNNYFGVDYSLGKLDHFPLNVDRTSIKAIENWGLIVYTSVSMIQKNQSNVEKYIYEIHEIIHQWVGNLMTLEDWSGYWINEGFTTYFSYIIADILYPEWNISRLFIDEINDDVFGYRSNAVVPTPQYNVDYDDSVPLEISTFSTHEIYLKAAAILKMFDEAIGAGIVLNTTRELLHEFSHSNINTEIIGNRIHWIIKRINQTIFYHEDMTSILRGWLTNHGTPKIYVNRNYHNDTISFTIETTNVNRRIKPSSYAHQTWSIPINFAVGSDPNFNNTKANFLVHSYKDNILHHSQMGFNNISTDDWLILNKQQSGLYSVVYDDYNTKLISMALISNHKQIHPVNRALLFRDFKLNMDNITDIVDIVDAFTYIVKEDDLYVVAEASSMMLNLLVKFRGSVLYRQLKTFLLKYSWELFDKFYIRQPLYLRKDVLVKYLAEIDSPQLLEHVHQQLTNTESLTNKSAYPINEASDMLTCVFFAHANVDTFSKILWWVQHVQDSQMLIDITYHIPCVRDKHLINKFLNIYFDGNDRLYLKPGDSFKLGYLAHLFIRSYIARPLILDLLLEKYESIFFDPKLTGQTMTRMMPYVSNRDRMKVIVFKRN